MKPALLLIALTFCLFLTIATQAEPAPRVVITFYIAEGEGTLTAKTQKGRPVVSGDTVDGDQVIVFTAFAAKGYSAIRWQIYDLDMTQNTDYDVQRVGLGDDDVDVVVSFLRETSGVKHSTYNSRSVNAASLRGNVLTVPGNARVVDFRGKIIAKFGPGTHTFTAPKGRYFVEVERVEKREVAGVVKK
jgi:hypothetical protein